MVRALLLLSGLLLSGCDSGERPILLAAASLERVLPGILEAQGIDATASFAATSTLVRQMEMGREADVLVCADIEWVERIARLGFSREVRTLGWNRIAIWGPEGSPAIRSPSILRSERWERIAVGDESVPVGRHARRLVRGLGVEQRLIPCRDARAVVRVLAAGEADVAIAYATDGAGIPGIKALWIMPGPPMVRYSAVRLRDSDSARALLDALVGNAAGRLLADHGFVPPRGEVPR